MDIWRLLVGEIVSAFWYLARLPRRAWNFSMRNPYEAFYYSLFVLLSANLSKLFLTLIAGALVFGSLYRIILHEKKNNFHR